MDNQSVLTPSLEDYVKIIYTLSQKQAVVRVTDVAAALNLTKPSVNRAMNTLKTMELLEHEHYGTLKLTPQGEAAAQEIIERYKVAYGFLKDVLGVRKETAKAEAHQMEHILSRETIKKLKKYVKKKK